MRFLNCIKGGGNISGVLRGEMPRIVRAEDESESKQGCELIYKKRNYSKWETSPKTMARTTGTPLPGHSLTHFSLLQRLLWWGVIEDIQISMEEYKLFYLDYENAKDQAIV